MAGVNETFLKVMYQMESRLGAAASVKSDYQTQVQRMADSLEEKLADVFQGKLTTLQRDQDVHRTLLF